MTDEKKCVLDLTDYLQKKCPEFPLDWNRMPLRKDCHIHLIPFHFQSDSLESVHQSPPRKNEDCILDRFLPVWKKCGKAFSNQSICDISAKVHAT